jgi:hypothetical protein
MNLRVFRTFKWVQAPQMGLGLFWSTTFLWHLEPTDTLQMEDPEGNWVCIPVVTGVIPPKPSKGASQNDAGSPSLAGKTGTA